MIFYLVFIFRFSAKTKSKKKIIITHYSIQRRLNSSVTLIDNEVSSIYYNILVAMHERNDHLIFLHSV